MNYKNSEIEVRFLSINPQVIITKLKQNKAAEEVLLRRICVY